MRILLCGADGQLGTSLAQTVPNFVQLLSTTKHQLDITSVKQVTAFIKLHNVDLIINAAAITDVEQAQLNSQLALAVNAQGVANLAAQNVPLVHISTDYVFAGDKSQSYVEQDCAKPLNYYGMSKLAGEDAIRRINPQHIIMRTSWLFGIYGTNFVTKIVHLSQNCRYLKMVTDQIGNPTSYSSVAYALWQIVLSYQRDHNLSWGTYHFAGIPSCSRYEFAQKIILKAHQLQIIKHKPQLMPILMKNLGHQTPRPLNSSLKCDLFQKTFSLELSNWEDDLHKVLSCITEL